MRIFKDMELVEQRGSGIPRVLQTYGRDCFKFSDHFVRMSFPMEMIEEMGSTVEKTVGKTVGKTAELLALIMNNPMMTQEVLAEMWQLSVRGVEYHLKKLKEEQMIERTGGRKGGYWKIIEPTK
ncbi:MAG: winged helix-turn-helix transcriptional regulator [Bacteroidetes bacterium]|nr:winged helix-turn-helix transcriptional regulator [Bacteroidota bacterium]MBS1739035.1 winged helix-turn-helix transcriptional regulator [Bacteroidota bacterium]